MKDTKTIFQKIINVISLMMLVGSNLYLALRWNSIAQEVPVHYDFYGQMDRMGSKNEILVLPIVMIVMFMGLMILEKNPKMWNTGVEINENNRARVYTAIRTMICSLRCFIIFIFSYLMISSLNAQTNLGIYFIITIIGMLILVIFGSLLRIFIKPKTKEKE